MKKELIEELLRKIDPSKVNIDLVRKAISFADYHHKGQKRLTGEEFICHPLKVAISCLEYNLKQDTEIIVSALLHDVVEDTNANFLDIKNLFGIGIARIVEGLSRSKKLNAKTTDVLIDAIIKNNAPIVKEYFKKLKVFTQKDEIIPYFKFVDALEYVLSQLHKKREKMLLDAYTSPIESVSDFLEFKLPLFETSYDILLLAEMMHQATGQDKEMPVISSLEYVFKTYEDIVINKICLIKILDRLDNLESIHMFDPQKQKRIKQNTITDILPLAIDLSIKILSNQIINSCNSTNNIRNFQFSSSLNLLRRKFSLVSY